MPNKKLNTTITGTTGFIGSTLVKFLNPNDYEITSLSLRNNDWVSNYPNGTKILINLIGKAHDHKQVATREDYFFTNYELVKKLFNKFIVSDALLFIHISSVATLDNKDDTNWYGLSKLKADEWLMSQKLPNNKKLIILRPPMVHGKGDKGNLRLLYNIISKGIPYPLSSFDNKRTFISIENFCFLINEVIQKHNMINSGIYYIADDESISTKEIVKIIKEVTRSKVPNIPLPKFLLRGIAKIGDFIPIPLNSSRLNKMTSDFLVSNVEIKDKLGITKLPLTASEGIQETINWLHKQD